MESEAATTTTAAKSELEGFVKPGYEPVQALLQKLLDNGQEFESSLCVFVGEEIVVNLAGKSAYHSASESNARTYKRDSLQLIFSASKPVVAVCIGILVDKRLIRSYNDKVSTYWPEFAGSGKEDITIADVLRHDANLAWLDHTFTWADLSREGILSGAVSSVIESQSLKRVDPDSVTRAYHSLTQGLICNEILRRVDPKGRTMSEFIQEEISGPFAIDVHLTPSDSSVRGRVADTNIQHPLSFYCKSILPWNRSVPSIGTVFSNFWHLFSGYTQLMKRADRLRGKDFAFLFSLFTHRSQVKMSPPSGSSSYFAPISTARSVLTGDQVRFESQLPSGNILSSAQGLAKLAAFLANRGKLRSQQLFSRETWSIMHSDLQQRNDVYFGGIRTNFSQGGLNKFTRLEDDVEIEKKFKRGRDNSFGWIGLGGATVTWDPELRLAFAYTPTMMTWHDLFNENAAMLQEEVLRCQSRIKQ